MMSLIDRRLNQKLSASAEHKFTGSSWDDVVVAYDAAYALSNLSEGNTENTRVGISVTWHHIDLFFNVKAQDPKTVFRILLVQDMQPNGSQCTIGEVLTSPLTTGLDYTSSLRYIPFLKRFRILYDAVYVLSIVWNDVASWSITIPLNIVTNYNGDNNGTIGDIMKNSITLFTLNNKAADGPQLSGHSRMFFTDV